MLETVLIPNGIGIALLLVLSFNAARVSRHMLLDTKMFFAMLLCDAIQCTGEIAACFVNGRGAAGFHLLGLIINALLFIFNILFAYLYVIYADYKIFEDRERIRKRGKPLLLPALIIISGSIVNLFRPVFFRITAENYYQRTTLFFIPYVVTYFYLSYGTIFIYKHKSQARKYVFLPAHLFMLPIIAGSLLQYLFYGLSTIYVSVAIALVSLYVNVQNEASCIDALSGLYTRVYMYQYLEMEFKRKGKQKNIAGIMLDIDEFKKINDTYGHLTGDDAIRSVGKILHYTLMDQGKGVVAVRYGGDEFIVLQQIEKEEEVLETMRRITAAEEEFNTRNAKKYVLHLSKGYSILDSTEDTLDVFLEQMDKAMYQAKRVRAEEKSAAGKN